MTEETTVHSEHTCCWVTDDGLPCGSPAEVYSHLPLCTEHGRQHRERTSKVRSNVARVAARFYSLDEFPGYCYFILLPDGYVKIGYSNTKDLLEQRMKRLSREYGAPVYRLAVIPGGFVAEAVMHSRFAEYRVPGPGERFSYSPQMAEYLDTLNTSDPR